MAQAWIIRAGRDEGYEATAFERGIVSVGWSKAGDLTSRSEAEIRDLVRAAYPEVEPRSARSYAIQLIAFRWRIERGDLVLLLRRSSPDVAVGWVTGQYRYRSDLGPGICHVRSVRWRNTNLPRVVVERELLSLPALSTIFLLNQRDIVERLRRLVGDVTDPHASAGSVAADGDGPLATPDVPESSKPFVNLQRNLNYARNLATAGQHLEKLQVGAFEVADVFRAAWVQSVAALDHWVRQEVRARMLRLARQSGTAKPERFLAFQMTLGQLEGIQRGDISLVDAIDLQLRETRGHMAFQHPDKIKEAFALVSDAKDLWGKVATVLGERADEGVKITGTEVRDQLRDIVGRRNKIAHEYDEDPKNPAVKQRIDAAMTTRTIDWIEQVAEAILVALDPKWRPGAS